MRKIYFLVILFLTGCVPGMSSTGGNLGYSLATMLTPQQPAYYRDPYYYDRGNSQIRSRDRYPTRTREVSYTKRPSTISRAQIEQDVEREFNKRKINTDASINYTEEVSPKTESELPSFGDVSVVKEQKSNTEEVKIKETVQPKETEDLPAF